MNIQRQAAQKKAEAQTNGSTASDRASPAPRSRPTTPNVPLQTFPNNSVNAPINPKSTFRPPPATMNAVPPQSNVTGAARPPNTGFVKGPINYGGNPGFVRMPPSMTVNTGFIKLPPHNENGSSGGLTPTNGGGGGGVPAFIKPPSSGGQGGKSSFSVVGGSKDGRGGLRGAGNGNGRI